MADAGALLDGGEANQATTASEEGQDGSAKPRRSCCKRKRGRWGSGMSALARPRTPASGGVRRRDMHGRLGPHLGEEAARRVRYVEAELVRGQDGAGSEQGGVGELSGGGNGAAERRCCGCCLRGRNEGAEGEMEQRGGV
jgi:hypothetical protein